MNDDELQSGKRFSVGGDHFEILELRSRGPIGTRSGIVVVRWRSLVYEVPRAFVELALAHQPQPGKCVRHPDRDVGPAAVVLPGLCAECASDRSIARHAAFYDVVYGILVHALNAAEDDRMRFIAYFMGDDGDCKEWRFGGKLGFGGKFWRNGGGHYVNYYREDQRPELEVLVAQVNSVIGHAEAVWRESA